MAALAVLLALFVVLVHVFEDKLFAGVVVLLIAISTSGCWRDADAHGRGYGPRVAKTPVLSSLVAAVPALTNTYSVDFDGLNDHVLAADAAAFEPGANLTVCIWAKFTNASCTTCGMLGKWIKPDATRDGAYALVGGAGSGSVPGRFALEVATAAGSGGGAYCESDAAHMTTGWKHYCATYNGAGSTNEDKVALYVNGALVAKTCAGTIPATIRDGDADVRQGQYIAGQYMEGRLDEPVVWHVTLSAGQISTFYNSAVERSPIGVHGTDPPIWLRNGDGDTYPTLLNGGSASPDFTMTSMAANDIVADTP